MKTGIDKLIYEELGLPLQFDISKAGFAKVSLPCLCQPKYDGELCFAYFDEQGEVFLFNKAKYGRWRTGMPATAQLRRLNLRNTYLTGELHWQNDFYGGFLRHKFDDDLHFACFSAPFDFKFSHAYTIPATLCRTEEALRHKFNHWTAQGFEGCVAKPNSDISTWVKLKRAYTADLTCLSADTDKEAVRLGYKGKEVCGAKVSGQGRQELVGRVLEVAHQGVIRTNGNMSLRHPVFKGVREQGKGESLV